LRPGRLAAGAAGAAGATGAAETKDLSERRRGGGGGVGGGRRGRRRARRARGRRAARRRGRGPPAGPERRDGHVECIREEVGRLALARARVEGVLADVERIVLIVQME
jgi:hypothetical protein